jgi:hypothetical protein
MEFKREHQRGFIDLVAAVFGTAILFVSLTASAMDIGQTKTVNGLTVDIGVIPAEIMKGHPKGHPEASAHGGPPTGQHEYHLVVAVFDAASGARITDAKVQARVSSLGLVGPQKPLEAMAIAGTITYGNYFDLPEKGRYTIDIEIERPAGRVRMEFMYER